MIQCKPPVTRSCNNLSFAGKRPVRIKSPLTQIQYLWEVPGFRSAGHILHANIQRVLNIQTVDTLKLVHILRPICHELTHHSTTACSVHVPSIQP